MLLTAAIIFAAQQLAISFVEPDGLSGVARQVLFFSTTFILAILALRLRRFAGAWLVSAGILLNLAPMALHQGSMPIDYAIIERSGAFPEVNRDNIGQQTNHGKDVVLAREDIHFFLLSDRFVVTVPGYGTNIYSLGDFVLFAGCGAVVIQAAGMAVMTRPRSAGTGQEGSAQSSLP